MSHDEISSSPWSVFQDHVATNKFTPVNASPGKSNSRTASRTRIDTSGEAVLKDVTNTSKGQFGSSQGSASSSTVGRSPNGVGVSEKGQRKRKVNGSNKIQQTKRVRFETAAGRERHLIQQPMKDALPVSKGILVKQVDQTHAGVAKSARSLDLSKSDPVYYDPIHGLVSMSSPSVTADEGFKRLENNACAEATHNVPLAQAGSQLAVNTVSDRAPAQIIGTFVNEATSGEHEPSTPLPSAPPSVSAAKQRPTLDGSASLASSHERDEVSDDEFNTALFEDFWDTQDVDDKNLRETTYNTCRDDLEDAEEREALIKEMEDCDKEEESHYQGLDDDDFDTMLAAFHEATDPAEASMLDGFDDDTLAELAEDLDAACDLERDALPTSPNFVRSDISPPPDEYEEASDGMNDIDDATLVDIFDDKDESTSRTKKRHSNDNTAPALSTSPDSRPVAAKPLTLPPPPKPAHDRSLIHGLSSTPHLSVHVRTGTALNAGCAAARASPIPSSSANSKPALILELYARILTAIDTDNGLEMVLTDLWSVATGPSIRAVYAKERWKGQRLWEEESRLLITNHGGSIHDGEEKGVVDDSKMVRVLGFMRRRSSGPGCSQGQRDERMSELMQKARSKWELEVMNVWECDWDDVEYVKGILEASRE